MNKRMNVSITSLPKVIIVLAELEPTLAAGQILFGADYRINERAAIVARRSRRESWR